MNTFKMSFWQYALIWWLFGAASRAVATLLEIGEIAAGVLGVLLLLPMHIIMIAYYRRALERTSNTEDEH